MSMPTKLYKYRSLADDMQWQYARNIIVDNEFYFCRPTEFNDPFECRPMFRVEGTVDEIALYFYKLLSRNRPELDEQSRRSMAATKASQMAADPPGQLQAFIERFHETQINNYGVLSLSADPENILMWAHYANNHRGICLEFSTDKALDNLCYAEPVTYQDEFPTINVLTAGDDPPQMMRTMLITKSKLWKYEQEWRLVDLDGHGPKQFNPGTLTGIIVGAKCSEESLGRLVTMANGRSPKPAFYSAALSNNAFKVVISKNPD